MTRPTVWVVKNHVMKSTGGSRPMDYSAAEAYGDIKFITDQEVPINRKWASAECMAKIQQDFEAFCRELKPSDFLILTGSPYLFYLLAAALAEYGHLFPNLLAWRREDSEYVALMGVDDWIANFTVNEETTIL